MDLAIFVIHRRGDRPKDKSRALSPAYLASLSLWLLPPGQKFCTPLFIAQGYSSVPIKPKYPYVCTVFDRPSLVGGFKSGPCSHDQSS